MYVPISLPFTTNTYKALHGLAPEYLQELVRIHKPNVNLRSSSKQYLARSKPKLKTYGEKSFSFASHHLWNNMPEPIRKAENIKVFKRALKHTFLNNHIKLFHTIRALTVLLKKFENGKKMKFDTFFRLLRINGGTNAKNNKGIMRK